MDSPDPAPEQEGRASVTAPRVEVVVVAHRPGAWFDEALTSIAAQDYPRYGVTVLVADDDDEPERIIRRALPDAAVTTMADDKGYGGSVNTLLANDAPPAFYLLCHDDVALSSDALRLLVEEAIRSNASVVGPKLVDWDHPDQLLEVGLDVDKLGHAASRVEVGELDQEQHDAVTDVFAVPGAVQLIRGDLFHALEGFDEVMGVTGEDVDFCWRAHVAGARVMVVPSAVVRHRAALGDRRPSTPVGRLQERHRLRTLLSIYGIGHSLRVIPQGIIYSLVRAVGALVTGQLAVARSAIGAWVWNLARPASLFRRRRLLRRTRKVPDGEIRNLQVRGFAPVSTYLRGQFGDDGRGTVGMRARNLLRALRTGPSRVSLGFWAIALVVLGFGSRHLITRGVPEVGDLVPFDLGPTALLDRWFEGWSSLGTGNEVAAPTAFGVTGAAGAVFLGFMGLFRTVATVGMLPIGAIGMWRLLRPFASPWIRVVGTLTYLVSPVPYNALGNGSWSALLLYGLLPWVVAGLGRAARVAPFGRLGGATGEGVLEPSWVREVLVLGLTMGAIGAFVPFVVVIAPAIVVCLVVGSVLAGWPAGSGRLVVVTAGGVVVAAALNLSWVMDALLEGPSWDWFAGTRPETPDTPGLTALLRFDTGEFGGGVLAWAVPVAGLIPLLLARGPRWAWAVRGLAMYLASVAVVWAAGNGWVPFRMPRPEVLLTVGALGLAISAAMGVAAIERDLRTYRFGWRQLIPVTAVVALVVAVLPPIGASFDGSWRMPGQDFNQQLGQGDDEVGQRVLWIGHDDVLGAGGRAFGEDLTVAVTSSRVVSFGDRWAGTPQPADELIGEALVLAVGGGTNRLGRLLAPFAIGEIVILEQAAPTPATGVVAPVPDALLAALTEQLDLEQVEITPGLVRYRNAAVVPVAAVVAEGTLSGVTLREFAGSRAPVTAGSLAPTDASWTAFTGLVTIADEVYLATPASDQWRLEVEDRVASSVPALEWAQAFQPTLSGEAELRYRTTFGHRVLIVGQALLWIVALVAVMRLNSRAREARR